MIPRALQPSIQRLLAQYPVLTITGPRQSGKTTLCRALFGGRRYLNLEDPDTRARAVDDPRSFLSGLPNGAVIDEIQRAPELPSYLQGIVDADDRPGRFVLTGSNQFEVIDQVTQSLAGRTALATLLPFSYYELYGDKRIPLDRILYAGFYPRIHDKALNPTEALSFYVRTYLERDVRSIAAIRALDTFERFLRLCAAWNAQAVNRSAMAADLGVDQKTIGAWLSVLQASYIIFLIPPHYRNLRKRIRKAPKLYFYDVGLCTYLLGIRNEEQLAHHPLRGALFESFVVSELLKHRAHRVVDNNLYYFRDSAGNEVDMIIDNAGAVTPLEIKSGATFHPSFLKGIHYYHNLTETNPGAVVYGGEEAFSHDGARVIPYHQTYESLSNLQG